MNSDRRPDTPGAQYYGPCDENGVDISLLRYMLALSVLERLKLMDGYARDTEKLLEYARQHRDATASARR